MPVAVALAVELGQQIPLVYDDPCAGHAEPPREHDIHVRRLAELHGVDAASQAGPTSAYRCHHD
jgi:hypothetical protein